jgi:hypothetical protein
MLVSLLLTKPSEYIYHLDLIERILIPTEHGTFRLMRLKTTSAIISGLESHLPHRNERSPSDHQVHQLWARRCRRAYKHEQSSTSRCSVFLVSSAMRSLYPLALIIAFAQAAFVQLNVTSRDGTVIHGEAQGTKSGPHSMHAVSCISASHLTFICSYPGTWSRKHQRRLR